MWTRTVTTHSAGQWQVRRKSVSCYSGVCGCRGKRRRPSSTCAFNLQFQSHTFQAPAYKHANSFLSSHPAHLSSILTVCFDWQSPVPIPRVSSSNAMPTAQRVTLLMHDVPVFTCSSLSRQYVIRQYVIQTCMLVMQRGLT